MVLMMLLGLMVLMVLRLFIEGGVAVDRLERLLVRAQHLTSGPIDTTLEEIVMDTADIRNYKQNNHLLKGKFNYFDRKSRNLSSSLLVHKNL
jgi:hypothetical protein